MDWGNLFSQLANKRKGQPGNMGMIPYGDYPGIAPPTPVLPAVVDAPPMPASRFPNVPSPLDSENLNVRPRMAPPPVAVLPEPRYAPELAGSLGAVPGGDTSWSPGANIMSTSAGPSADVRLRDNPADEARMRRKYQKSNGGIAYPDLRYDNPDKQAELEWVRDHSGGSKLKQIGRGILAGMSQSGGRDWGAMLGGAISGGIWGGVDPEGVAKVNYDRYVFPQMEQRRMREWDQMQREQKLANEQLQGQKTIADIRHLGNQDQIARGNLEQTRNRDLSNEARWQADLAERVRQFNLKPADIADVEGYAQVWDKNTGQYVPFTDKEGQPVLSGAMARAIYGQEQQNLRAREANQNRVYTTGMAQSGQDRRAAAKTQADDSDVDSWMQALDDAKNAAKGSPIDPKTGKMKANIQNAINKLKKYPNVVVGEDENGWPYAQKTSTAVPAARGGSKGTATPAMIQNYAKLHGVTPDVARRKAIADGYTVQ